MSHYVCKDGSCGAVKDGPGLCESDFCNKKGEELMICGCEDGEHKAGEHTTHVSAEESV